MKEVVEICVGSGGLLAVILLIFRTGRTIEKLDAIGELLIETKTDLKDFKTDSDKHFGMVNRNISNIEIQLGKLETRVEERTLRVVHGGNMVNRG